MDPPVDSFWAKLRPYGGGEVHAWHPLPAHAADVAACLEGLLSRSRVRQRLARLGGQNDLTDIQVQRLCVLAALHDIGKFNIGFQNKKLARPEFTAGHVSELLAAFGSEAGTRIASALRIEEMGSWGEREETLEDLLITSFAHHGRPQPVGGVATPGAWTPTDELDPFEGIRLLREQIESWYPNAYGEGSEPLPAAPRFQHAFNGLLTLADWLGSNESFFPFQEPGDPPRIDFARSRAREALRHIGLDPAPTRSALIAQPPSFADVWPFNPRPAQRRMEELDAGRNGSLTILEAPTGSGKTEAALIRFVHLFSAGEVDGLYFALPTRAAASQIYERVQEAIDLATALESDALPPVTLAVPGYLSDDEQGGPFLPSPETRWTDEDWRRWRYRSWASERPKRYLAGMIVVGTIDQVLLSTLAVDHSHLRASSLLRHLLVVDEVHASDAYMSRLLEAVLQRHIDAGGHALLMSATLGEVARHRFLELAGREELDRRSRDEAVSVPYPVVMTSTVDREQDVHPIDDGSREQKSVEVELLPLMSDSAALADRCLTAAARGARVLVVRNTVRGCRAVQEAMEAAVPEPDDSRLFSCSGVKAPHHSRFASPDRTRLDWTVEEEFGKDRPTGGLALSATQTVEQSLDIDADLLVTDLCPADVLLQRIGRLHRHARPARPEGYRTPRVVILVPESRDLSVHIQEGGEHAGRAWGPHGLGTVYEDLRVLEATWSELRSRDTIDVPADNRRLVETATHPEVLDRIAQAKGGAWIDHARTMDGMRRARKGMADLNLAEWSVPFGHRESLFPDRPDERIKTRLGEGDRRAVLLEPIVGPFGEEIREFTVPFWMAPDADEEVEAELVSLGDGEVVFRFGSRRYRYDRWGLRRTGD